MSQFNQNGSDYDSEGLPPSVRRYVYQGKEHFSRTLQFERECFQRHSYLTAEFFVFSIDTFTFRRDFSDTETPIRGIRTTFNPRTNILIVKMVTHEHHTVVRAFDLAIDDVLRPMGMDEKVLTYAGVDIDVDGISKQPDWGWGPRRPPLGQPRRRPTVVIEVAMSETRAKLHRDVELWVDPERGNMNIAFTVKVNRNCAIITIGKWEWDYANNQARMSQEIEIHKNEAGDHVTVSGAPLIIPFNLLFLRYAIPPKETDLTIKGEKFEYIADLVWELQFADF